MKIFIWALSRDNGVPENQFFITSPKNTIYMQRFCTTAKSFVFAILFSVTMKTCQIHVNLDFKFWYT